MAAHWIPVQFEIPGMNNLAHRGLYAKTETFNNGMTDREKIKGKISQLQRLFFTDHKSLDIIAEIEFNQFIGHELQGEP